MPAWKIRLIFLLTSCSTTWTNVGGARRKRNQHLCRPYNLPARRSSGTRTRIEIPHPVRQTQGRLLTRVQAYRQSIQSGYGRRHLRHRLALDQKAYLQGVQEAPGRVHTSVIRDMEHTGSSVQGPGVQIPASSQSQPTDLVAPRIFSWLEYYRRRSGDS